MLSNNSLDYTVTISLNEYNKIISKQGKQHGTAASFDLDKEVLEIFYPKIKDHEQIDFE
jgi:hypothetical protein